jgi:hypothetical protein
LQDIHAITLAGNFAVVMVVSGHRYLEKNPDNNNKMTEQINPPQAIAKNEAISGNTLEVNWRSAFEPPK